MTFLLLDDRAEYTLSKLERVADITESYAVIQRNLDRVEKYADRNILKFNKKSKILCPREPPAGKQLGRKGPGMWWMLR